MTPVVAYRPAGEGRTAMQMLIAVSPENDSTEWASSTAAELAMVSSGAWT